MHDIDFSSDGGTMLVARGYGDSFMYSKQALGPYYMRCQDLVTETITEAYGLQSSTTTPIR